MAQRRAVQAEKSRIDATRVVSIEPGFKKDPAYEISYGPRTPQTGTGFKKVFELTCPGQPTFIARWEQDVADFDKEGRLDIDIRGVSNAARTRFKNSERGSSGHQTTSLGSGRYRLDIVYKGQNIFSGVVHVGVDYEGEARGTIQFSGLVIVDTPTSAPSSDV